MYAMVSAIRGISVRICMLTLMYTLHLVWWVACTNGVRNRMGLKLRPHLSSRGIGESGF